MKKAAADRNYLVIASLTLAFETDELTSIMLTAHSDECSEGLASEVIKKLKEKCKPDDIMSLVDEKMELKKVRMSPSENPKCLFDKIKFVEITRKHVK